MKQKVVWPLNLQYQVWEISEKCTHPFGKSCVEPFVCLPNWGFFPSENIYLEKKGMLRVFISMQCFPSLCPKCGFCSFWPSESQPAAQQWVAQFQGWVRSRSKGMSYGDPNPLFWQYFFFKVPPVLHCFLIALILQGMLVKRVGPSFIVCWWFSSSIFITDLSCCCNDTTLQL